MFPSDNDMIDLDGVNHGKYRLEDCIWCVIYRCEDGYISCALLGSGTWTCEDCMKILEEREEREP